MAQKVTPVNLATGQIVAGTLGADTAGRAIMADSFFNEATVDAKVAAQAIDSDRLKNASVTSTQLAVGGLTADATGRAVMATGFFTEAAATDKFATQAITTGIIKDANVTTAKIAGANVTPAKLVGTLMSAGSFVGVAAPGPCTLTGALVGDRVLVGWKSGDVSDNLTAGQGSVSTRAAFVALFETTITVADQIQQASASDLSDNKYSVILLPASA